MKNKVFIKAWCNRSEASYCFGPFDTDHEAETWWNKRITMQSLTREWEEPEFLALNNPNIPLGSALSDSPC